MSGGFLDRWSRRKLASAGKALLADAPASGMPPAAEPGGQGELVPSGARLAHAPDAGAEAAVSSAVEAQLPAVEGLTLASDFTGFLKEEVSEALRRKALQKLFADPHFNRMDGLDIYIDDYSLPDPIPPEAMAKLKSAREWLMANETEVEAGAEAPVLPADRTDAEDVPSDATNGDALEEPGGERASPGCAADAALRTDASPVAGGVAAEPMRAAGHERGTRESTWQGGVQEGGTQQRDGAVDVGNAALRAATSSAEHKAIKSGQKAP